jgi:hypothetical protein
LHPWDKPLGFQAQTKFAWNISSTGALGARPRNGNGKSMKILRFIGDFLMKPSVFWGFPSATFDDRRVYII